VESGSIGTPLFLGAGGMGDQLTLRLMDMAHGGEAVGKHERKVIFVPYAIPGEYARVEVIEDRGRFARARVLQILEASPRRVEAPCPYFGRCGGCQWQHLAYDAQLEYKRSIVLTQLQRIAGLSEADVRPTLGMEVPWRYRNRVQFHASDDGQLGFMAAHSHDIVPIEQCLIMHPLLGGLFDALDAELPDLVSLSLRAGIHTGDQMVIFELGSDQPPELEVDLPVSCLLRLSDGTPVTLVGSPYLREQVAGREYRISASSFFQVNTLQAEVLALQVSSMLRPKPDNVVLDGYCGVGVFALGLAEVARQVIGVEVNTSAVADAQANAAGVENVSFVSGPMQSMLPKLGLAEPLVVVDPPRTGLQGETLAALLKLDPPRIVYVSCDPATLARDVKALLAAGYLLRSVQPVDMFPQTYHIETVTLLERA
jgi:23S rRNA (uracil1939-C5)-methyltransferase